MLRLVPRNRHVAAVAGVGLLLAAWVCLERAYSGSSKPPLALRPFMWWR